MGRMKMNPLLLSALGLWVVLVTTDLSAGEVAPDTQQRPKVTVVGGSGNAMGWLGGQFERYLWSRRSSLFLGVGRTLDRENSIGSSCIAPSGATYAFGGRMYSSGYRHRVFLEASISQVVCRWACSSDSSVEGEGFYGPGVQLGYQYITTRGFTAVASIGVGYALDSEVMDQTATLVGLGLGYSWR